MAMPGVSKSVHALFTAELPWIFLITGSGCSQEHPSSIMQKLKNRKMSLLLTKNVKENIYIKK